VEGSNMAFIVRSGDDVFRIGTRLLAEEEPEERYLVLVNDDEYTISVARTTPTQLSILMGGESYLVEVDREAEGIRVSVRGEEFLFTVEDEYLGSSGGQSESGMAVVSAPMPGLVAKVLVRVGDRVEPGQGLLILEAMKMQNEITSSRGGTVKEVSVERGKTVMTGDTLVVIE